MALVSAALVSAALVSAALVSAALVSAALVSAPLVSATLVSAALVSVALVSVVLVSLPLVSVSEVFGVSDDSRMWFVLGFKDTSVLSFSSGWGYDSSPCESGRDSGLTTSHDDSEMQSLGREHAVTATACSVGSGDFSGEILSSCLLGKAVESLDSEDVSRLSFSPVCEKVVEIHLAGSCKPERDTTTLVYTIKIHGEYEQTLVMY